MEGKHTSKISSAQLSRITAAAAHVSQARLLLLQERRVTLDTTKTHSISAMAESLEASVRRLEEIQRIPSIDSVHAQYVPTELFVSEVAP